MGITFRWSLPIRACGGFAMRKMVFAFMLAVAAVVAVYTQRDFAAGGDALDEFTLKQTVVVRDGSGEVSSFEKTFVQRADGAYVQTEEHHVAGVCRCESGGIFTATARVSYHSCTQARSTFPARGEVERRNQWRRRESCVNFLAGGKAGPRGNMWGVRTEEYVLSNQQEDATYVVSPDLGCQTLSEVHKWKEQGGAVTVLTTTDLEKIADSRHFAAAGALREMPPSRARTLWAAKLCLPTSAAWFQKAKARLDQQYWAQSSHQ
jgi:hypothetical protein